MFVVLMYRVLTCKLGNSRNISIICTFSVQGVRWPMMSMPPTLAIKGSNFSYNLKVCPSRFMCVIRELVLNTYWVFNTLKKYWYWIFNTFCEEILEKVLILSAWRSKTQYFFQEFLISIQFLQLLLNMKRLFAKIT